MLWYVLAFASFAAIVAWTWRTRGPVGLPITHDDDVETALRARLGGDPSPELDDLARHHAFDMAARGYDGPRDPDGEDLAGRMRRLAPKLLATLDEVDARRSWEIRPTPQEVEAALAAALGRSEGGSVGVGVATRGRTWTACVVRGEILGRLASVRRTPPPGFGVEVRVEGAVDGRLQLALRDSRGVTVATGTAAGGVLIARAEAAERWVLLDRERPLTEGAVP